MTLNLSPKYSAVCQTEFLFLTKFFHVFHRPFARAQHFTLSFFPSFLPLIALGSSLCFFNSAWMFFVASASSAPSAYTLHFSAVFLLSTCQLIQVSTSFAQINGLVHMRASRNLTSLQLQPHFLF